MGSAADRERLDCSECPLHSLSPGQTQEQAAHVLQLWTSFFTPSQAGDAAAAKAPVTAPAKTGTAKPETDKT